MTKKKGATKVRAINSLSPEKFVRTRARDMPIHACWINTGWDDMGFATVMVVRAQSSGYFTFATFLVDIYCLGVKNSLWGADATEAGYQEALAMMRQSYDLEPCDYALAHTLVWGGLDYAADLGFEPDADFGVAQYLLSPRRAVPFVDAVEFGHEGRPCFVVGPYDDVDRVIAQLEQRVGPNGYEVIDERDDDDAWDFVPDEDDGEEVEDLVWPEFTVTADMMHESQFFPTLNEIDYEVLEQLHRDTTQQPKKAIREVNKLIKTNPDLPMLYDYLATALVNDERPDEAADVYRTAHNRFPDYLYAAIGLGLHLVRRQQFDELAELFGPDFDLARQYPGRQRFHVSEVLNFHLLAATYFTQLKDEARARTYYGRVEELLAHFNQHLPNLPLTEEPNDEVSGALQLKITLRDVKPPVWRRVKVPAHFTFYELHVVIQTAMGWEEAHLYEFVLPPFERIGDGTDNTDATTVRLGDLLHQENQKLAYTYDFGDNWEHQIVVEKVLPDEHLERPVCTAGRRAAPPEDCGGVFGYEHFLEAMHNPRHPDHRELRQWYGGAFDPEMFERTEINDELALVFGADA
ncbi:MAG: hypothetical protein WBA12_13505 [Catalinimonas sp.]